MHLARPKHKLCNACAHHLLTIFAPQLSLSSPSQIRCGKYASRTTASIVGRRTRRPFSTFSALRGGPARPSETEDAPADPAEIELIVRKARQTFGDRLPEDFLSPEEYRVYERLYGPPTAVTRPEDAARLLDPAQIFSEDDVIEAQEGDPPHALYKEDDQGNLEEVLYERAVPEDSAEEYIDEALKEEIVVDNVAEEEETTAPDIIVAIDELPLDSEDTGEFDARVQSLRDKSVEELERRNEEIQELLAKAEQDRPLLDREEVAPEKEENEGEEYVEIDGEEIDENDPLNDNEYFRAPVMRGHPLTRLGQSGTYPSTINMPETMLEPVTQILEEASNRHLAEVAEQRLGGKGLPNSTATFKRPNLAQRSIGLTASQHSMGQMEANVYLATIYPGAYASALSILVETRKRLGADWLRGLMAKPGGPRIMDAGAGGAGILAWREIARAEHKAMGQPSHEPVPYGKSTVVTGSDTLRHRVSKFLDNTTFVPYLPEYDPTQHHPSIEHTIAQPRTKYDIIIAPYTLWPLREDYMRKSHVQNLWTLLNPDGGVLVLIEKGVAIGFEMIAGARDTLLKHHIESPTATKPVTQPEPELESDSSSKPNQYTLRSPGMIVAPCTNHARCPMYTFMGRSQGRKDFCHFSQRFTRPQYLQRIVGARETNHEDIRFSYVAVQRGKDERQRLGFSQGPEETRSAFAGYEEAPLPPGSEDIDVSSTWSPASDTPNPLTFPRLILPPMKRKGHVVLDLCTPAGAIERWTVTKSLSRQAYRDARKALWGDLWALGAKSRVARNLRVRAKDKKNSEPSPSVAEQLDELERTGGEGGGEGFDRVDRTGFGIGEDQREGKELSRRVTEVKGKNRKRKLIKKLRREGKTNDPDGDDADEPSRLPPMQISVGKVKAKRLSDALELEAEI